MHYTLAQSFTAISTLAAGWLMVRAGAAKKRLVVRKSPRVCPSCGRRRVDGRCRCTDGGS
jgi:hypothetical protein